MNENNVRSSFAMKLYKKITALLLVTVMSVGCCACSVDRNKTAKSLDINGEVTINVWYSDESYTSYLNYAAEQFHKANELVTIHPVLVSAEDYLQTIYDGSVRNGNVADVYLLASDNKERARLMGLMAENDVYASKYTVAQQGNAAITACSHDGKLYGYPLSYNTAFMIYNTKYVSSVDTFTQLTDYSNAYQVNDDNQNVQMVATWDVTDTMLNYAFGGKYIQVNETVAEGSSAVQTNTAKLKEAMTEYAKLKEAYGISKDDVNKDYCIDKFKQGKLLYTILDADSLRQINESDISYGICSVPALTDNLESQAMSDTTMTVVNPYTANVQTAKAVAHAISYDYADELEAYSGHLSTRADVVSANHKDAYNALHDVYANSVSKAGLIGSEELYLRYGIMIHKVWDGTAADAACDAFNTVVSKITK
jgi:maltose-binding protein MalE